MLRARETFSANHWARSKIVEGNGQIILAMIVIRLRLTQCRSRGFVQLQTLHSSQPPFRDWTTLTVPTRPPPCPFPLPFRLPPPPPLPQSQSSYTDGSPFRQYFIGMRQHLDLYDIPDRAHLAAERGTRRSSRASQGKALASHGLWVNKEQTARLSPVIKEQIQI